MYIQLKNQVMMNIGNFHSIMVHIPTAFLTIALICDLLSGIGKQKCLRIGHWMIWMGTVLCIPAIITGIYASRSFPAADPGLYAHFWLAYATGFTGVLYSFLRWMANKEKIFLPAPIYVGLSIILLALISWTSDFGNVLSKERKIQIPFVEHKGDSLK